MASLPLQFSEIDMAEPSKKNKRNRTYKNKKDLGSRVKSFLTAMEGGDESGLEDFQPGRSDPNLAGAGQRGKIGQVDMARRSRCPGWPFAYGNQRIHPETVARRPAVTWLP